MTISSAHCSKKGQVKIQQMAFVLVAFMILFAIVLLFYFSIRFNTLEQDVTDLREQETIETVQKIAGTAEFSWNGAGDCSSCIDFDKAFVLQNRTSYDGFWKNIALLQVVRVYPTYEGIACTPQNYPHCDSITLVDENAPLRGHSAFVSLCYYDSTHSRHRCDLGKVIMAFETIE